MLLNPGFRGGEKDKECKVCRVASCSLSWIERGIQHMGVWTSGMALEPHSRASPKFMSYVMWSWTSDLSWSNSDPYTLNPKRPILHPCIWFRHPERQVFSTSAPLSLRFRDLLANDTISSFLSDEGQSRATIRQSSSQPSSGSEVSPPNK